MEKEKPVPLGTSDEFCVVEVVVLELLLPSAGLFPNEKPLGFDGSEDWLLFSVGFEPNENPPGLGELLSPGCVPNENPPGLGALLSPGCVPNENPPDLGALLSAGCVPNENPPGLGTLLSAGFEPNEKPPGFGAVLSVDFAPKENPPPEDVVFSAAVLVEDALEFTGFPKLKPPEDAGFPPNEIATGLVSSLGLADPNKPVDGCEGAELDDSAGFGA